MRHADEFCTATVFLGNAMLTCDHYAGHEGPHGGVYPGEIDGKTAVAPNPQPLFIVRCTARGCDWSVTSNVAKRLGQFWRWHAAWHRSNDTNSRSSRVGGATKSGAGASCFRSPPGVEQSLIGGPAQ